MPYKAENGFRNDGAQNWHPKKQKYKAKFLTCPSQGYFLYGNQILGVEVKGNLHWNWSDCQILDINLQSKNQPPNRSLSLQHYKKTTKYDKSIKSPKNMATELTENTDILLLTRTSNTVRISYGIEPIFLNLHSTSD